MRRVTTLCAAACITVAALAVSPAQAGYYLIRYDNTGVCQVWDESFQMKPPRWPSDVAGVYGAAGAGLAVGSGARAIVLTNQKGAVLELSGRQVGLMANADLSGLAITMR